MQPFPIESAPGDSTIALFRLDQGRPVVVLDHDLIRRLEATLAALPRTAEGLILASAGERAFVAGADLKAIQQLSDAELLKYLEYAAGVFARLLDLPYPTAAAIHGAVLGGGLELAMHCDGLIAAPSPTGKPYPVGLPEASLCICPGWGGTNLLPARMEAGEAIRRTATGQVMNVDQAVAAGLFDVVAPSASELISAAASWIASSRKERRAPRDGMPRCWIGRACRKGSPAEVVRALDRVRPELPDTESARAVVEAVDTGLTRGWHAALRVERERLVYLRNTPAGKAAIEAFFARSGGKA